jgi:hypothetical protein
VDEAGTVHRLDRRLYWLAVPSDPLDERLEGVGIGPNGEEVDRPTCLIEDVHVELLLLILGALVAACGTPTPSAPSLRTKGGPPPTPMPPPSSSAAAVRWASLSCGRLDHATCLRIVTMVEDFAPTQFGPTTSVVADYSCPPGAFCEVGFHALVVLIPAGMTSQADLAIFYVSGLPDQPQTVGPYPYSLPEFMQSLLPGQAPSPSPVSAQAAASIAIGQVSSTIPVTVVSTKLSTYGAEASGGSVVDAGTPVWAVELSGSFRFPSCGPATATPHPCPSPATSELVLVDARTGAFIEGLMPAPSPS